MYLYGWGRQIIQFFCPLQEEGDLSTSSHGPLTVVTPQIAFYINTIKCAKLMPKRMNHELCAFVSFWKEG